MAGRMQRDLTYEVEHTYRDHTGADRFPTPTDAAVKIAGDIVVHENVPAGALLVVVVTGPDGEVLGRAEVEASTPSFVQRVYKGVVIGIGRVTKLKVTGGLQ